MVQDSDRSSRCDRSRGGAVWSARAPAPASAPPAPVREEEHRLPRRAEGSRPAGHGRHEYEKDLRALAEYLETSPNLKGVQTKVFVGKAPRDLAESPDAAAIVIESSSDRDAKETHPLFPQEPTTDRRTYDAGDAGLAASSSNG